MSDLKPKELNELDESNSVDPAGDGTEVDEAKERLDLQVDIASPSACERHVTVTVAREDIERYFQDAFDEVMPEAQVPGFRAGRAPRKLVETRFRKQLAEKIKGSLVLDSIAQIGDDEELSAISEPDFDFDSIELPDEGPMIFEYKLEVRPEFNLPNWKGLELERPVKEFTREDIDQRLERSLLKHGKLIPKEGPAKWGDYVAVNLTFRDDDRLLSQSTDEEVIRIRKVLSFRDGTIEGFDELMEGAKAGDTRKGTARISADAPNVELRGKTVDAIFEVLDVKTVQLPELTPSLLERLGGYESEADLRDAVLDDLNRQLKYHQGQRARRQVTAALTEAANWELPPDLLKRQSIREMERSILELQRSGFSESEIRAHANELRQNILTSTARRLKEHFILEKIAEEEKIEEKPEDYDTEIELIAAQVGESPRRIRARLEKQDLMDVMRNQIIESKVLDLIYSHAKFVDIPFVEEAPEAEAVDQSVAGGEDRGAAIPQAKYDDPVATPGRTEDRT